MVMMNVTREVCGVTRKKVSNLWTIGKEERLEKRKERIKVAMKRINERRQEIQRNDCGR